MQRMTYRVARRPEAMVCGWGEMTQKKHYQIYSKDEQLSIAGGGGALGMQGLRRELSRKLVLI